MTLVNEINLPKYIGFWYIREGQIKISTEIKPNLWKRFWLSFFFGIEWVEGY